MHTRGRRSSWRPKILVIGRSVHALERRVAIGIYACARARGWEIISEHENLRQFEQWIQKWRPQSVLMTFSSPAAVARAAAMAPTAAAMCYTDGLSIPVIDVDHVALARAAAEHLRGLRLRHFAVLGKWQQRWAVALRRAFERDMRKAGFRCILSGGSELGERAIRASDPARTLLGKWILSLPKPIGVFAIHDPWSRELAQHCLALDIAVPEEVSIIGVNNDATICEMTIPPLSSVAVNWQQIGYDAAELAGRLAAGERVEPVRRLVGPAGVVVRQSSDLLSVDDPDVAAALRLIREHADRPLSVEQILRAVPVHRHRLERRFRELVGRRMLQEVRRVHIEQAKRLLATTDLTMPDVAARSGLANAAMLAVAFREEAGVTPTAFRKQFRLQV